MDQPKLRSVSYYGSPVRQSPTTLLCLGVVMAIAAPIIDIVCVGFALGQLIKTGRYPAYGSFENTRFMWRL